MDTSRKPLALSVVVPVYNSASTLERLAERLAAVMGALAVDWELILVNDGSQDGSWEHIAALGERDPHVLGINLLRNYGQHNALLCGIRAARHPIVVTLDDDLQHPPEEIPKLLGELEQGYDVVYGSPADEQHDLWRGLASRLSKLAMQRVMGVTTAPTISAFRAFRTELRQAFANFSGPNVNIDVLLAWGTTRFGAVEVRHEERSEGRSGYTFRRLVTHAFNMITGFSTLPLQVASLLGFFFTLFGLGILAYVVGRYLVQGTTVPGFPFLASVIAIFAGAQLFALGIMGEYLARMYFRSLERPAYAVRSTTTDGGA